MPRSFFPSVRSSLAAGLFVAALAVAPAFAQNTNQPTSPNAETNTSTQTTGNVTGTTTTTTDASGKKTDSTSVSLTLSNKKKKVSKDERVQQTKDTKKEEKKQDKYNALLGKDTDLPEKQLYDKALAQEKQGHFDVARLDLNTLMSTYPDSQYLLRAKLAVADCWFQEGGSAALTQAEQEYKDFITFFPNAPEAAEAQKRVGDIYFKQMDVPDRDYTKALHAEEEYRTLLRQYPDAPKKILDEGRQRLRDVQEALATREEELAQFYAAHENWAASIARYQTVVDTYPQYSRMDASLIALGDDWEAQANAIRKQPLPANLDPKAVPVVEAGKAKLEEEFDTKAADAYRKVVLEHAASPRVEDAKERLVGMNLPVPKPTAEQVAASQALEDSRSNYTMSKRVELFFVHKPDTVRAAGTGTPSLDDPTATTAPAVATAIKLDYTAAFNPTAAAATPAPVAPAAPDAAPAAPAAPTAPVSNAPLSLSDVPGPGQGSGSDTNTMTPGDNSSSPGGTGVGVEVLTPGTKASNLPASTGTPDANYGLTSPAAKSNAPLPAAEKPAEADSPVNEAAGLKQPDADNQTTPDGKKKPKAAYDKNDASSSQHPDKKGIDKLNPF